MLDLIKESVCVWFCFILALGFVITLIQTRKISTSARYLLSWIVVYAIIMHIIFGIPLNIAVSKLWQGTGYISYKLIDGLSKEYIDEKGNNHNPLVFLKIFKFPIKTLFGLSDRMLSEKFCCFCDKNNSYAVSIKRQEIENYFKNADYVRGISWENKKYIVGFNGNINNYEFYEIRVAEVDTSTSPWSYKNPDISIDSLKTIAYYAFLTKVLQDRSSGFSTALPGEPNIGGILGPKTFKAVLLDVATLSRKPSIEKALKSGAKEFSSFLEYVKFIKPFWKSMQYKGQFREQAQLLHDFILKYIAHSQPKRLYFRIKNTRIDKLLDKINQIGIMVDATEFLLAVYIYESRLSKGLERLGYLEDIIPHKTPKKYCNEVRSSYRAAYLSETSLNKSFDIINSVATGKIASYILASNFAAALVMIPIVLFKEGEFGSVSLAVKINYYDYVSKCLQRKIKLIVSNWEKTDQIGLNFVDIEEIEYVARLMLMNDYCIFSAADQSGEYLESNWWWMWILNVTEKNAYENAKKTVNNIRKNAKNNLITHMEPYYFDKKIAAKIDNALVITQEQ